MKECQTCKGTGKTYNPSMGNEICLTCNGRGIILSKKEKIREEVKAIEEKTDVLKNDRKRLLLEYEKLRFIPES